ncbi:MAG TPA: hypothetical protein VHJ17_22320, partial [Thermomonospora sp.]|nr:hypothetical protein [Thermomonospora sp.]
SMAAGGAAGGSAVAGTAAGTGLLAATGAKVTLAVAGTALAVGAGTGVAVVTNGDDGPSPPVPQNVRLASAALDDRTLQVPGGRRFIIRGARYLRVSGHTDPAVERRINAALRAPLDQAAEAAHRVVRQNPEMGRPGIQCDGASLASRAFPGLRTSRLVSVRYELRAGWVCNSDFVNDWTITVTVALDTGRVLGPAEMLKPAALTPAGLAGLWARVPKPAPTPDPAGECRVPARLRPADLLQVGQSQIGDRPADLGITQAGLTFTVFTQGQSEFCPMETLTVPLDRVRDVLRPEFAALVSGTPAPRRS